MGAAAFGDSAADILALMNHERAALGLHPLEVSDDASAVADARALEIATIGSLTHASPNGADATSLLDSYGVDFARLGENLGWANWSNGDLAGLLHSSWMASHGHRENILDPDFGRVGVAVATSGSGFYVAVIFLD